MNYLGLDLSLTGTGAVVLDEEGHIKFNQTLKFKEKGMERLHKISTELNRILCKYEPEVIAIEGYSMGSRAGQAFSIGELGGVTKLLIYRSGFDEPILVAPTRLKKYITGKGNSPKDTIMMHVFKNWGFEAPDNNVADAYGLCQIALAIGQNVPQIAVNDPSKLLKHQKDIIALIRKGE